MSESSPVPVIIPDWEAPEHVTAFTTTRQGGVSKPPFDSLNVAKHVGDHERDVDINRGLLNVNTPIHWLEQIHSNRIVQAGSDSYSADASFAISGDVACAVMTADCLPILLYCKQGDCVAAIHAGWRGLASGIIPHSIRKLPTQPGNLVAWIGPAISQANFQVGAEVVAHFTEFDNVISVSRDEDKYLVDMAEVAKQQLQQSGVQEVIKSGLCTYADDTRFFSHRRATHQGHTTTGRMVSVIALR